MGNPRWLPPGGCPPGILPYISHLGMCGPKGKGLDLFGLKTGIFESSQEKALNISHFLVTKKNISIFRQNSWVNNGRPIQSVCVTV